MLRLEHLKLEFNYQPANHKRWNQGKSYWFSEVSRSVERRLTGIQHEGNPVSGNCLPAVVGFPAGNVLEPALMGKSLDLPPVAALMAGRRVGRGRGHSGEGAAPG